MARPTKYKPEYAGQAKKLIRKGFTDSEVADFFGVDITTLRNWRMAHPEFLSANTRTKPEADALVERSLFEVATGYSHAEVKHIVVGGKLRTIKTVKHYPPEVSAIGKWLFNRQPSKWRSNPEGVTGDANEIAAAVRAAVSGMLQATVGSATQ